MSWEALPPRRRQRRADTSHTSQSVEVSVEKTADDTHKQENVQDLLAATDGCAGEFYECMFVYFLIRCWEYVNIAKIINT